MNLSTDGHVEWDARSKILQSSSHLEDWELLSILFGSGTRELDVYSFSRELLHSIGGMESVLGLSSQRIPYIKGMGPAKKAILLALAEIIRRVRKKDLFRSTQNFPFSKIYETLWPLVFKETRESFYLVNFFLDGRLARLERISQGSLMEVGVHKRDIAKMILDDSSGFSLIAHNHPQHSASPSDEDMVLFDELSQFLSELEVVLIDQWILGYDGLYSCRFHGFLDPTSWDEENLPKEYDFLADNFHRL